MLINNIRKVYQETHQAVKKEEELALDKFRKDQAALIVKSAVEAATEAAKKLQSSAGFTFGAHPGVCQYVIDFLVKGGITTAIIRKFKDPRGVETTSIVMTGWDTKSEEKETVTSMSPNSIDNATVISHMMREANRSATIDEELIRLTIKDTKRK